MAANGKNLLNATNGVPSDALTLIHGSGEMADLTRAYDWETSPLGPIGQWPTSLLTVVNALLSTRQPMFLWWGEDLIQFYNDAYRPSLGQGKHPTALGQKGQECWPEIWNSISPQIESVMREGKASWNEDQLLPIFRNGRLEDVYWTYSYSPVWGEEGTVRGTLVVCVETTKRVIAEQERAEAARTIGDERTRLLEVFQQAPGFFCLLKGPSHIFALVNPPYMRLVGDREVLGKTVREALPEAAEQGYVDILDSVYRTGQPFTGQGARYDVAPAEGQAPEERYLDFVYQPMRELDGTISGILVMGVDVTERKRSGALVEASNQLQRFLLSLADRLGQLSDPRDIMQAAAEAVGLQLRVDRVGFGEATPDGELVQFRTGWAQGALVTLSGATPIVDFGKETAAAFRRGETVVYPDVRHDPRVENLDAYLSIGALSVLAVPFLRGGQWRGTLYVNHPEMRNWSPAEVELVQQVAERTAEAVERAQVEAELKSSEERLRLAQQAGMIASWDWDLATGNFIWNEGSAWIYGRPLAELDHVDKLFSYIHPDDIAALQESLKPVLEGTGEFTTECRICWPDGSIHWVIGRAQAVLSADGKPVRIVGINMDVTERKRSEQALIQNEKLAVVGRLASSIAHEINNPLESVTNLLYLARSSSNLSDARQYLDTADIELRRASAITNQTLRFHKQSSNPIEISCDELIGNVLSVHESRLVNSAIRVEKRKRAHRTILCFDGEIRQVISNLVGNAIDAMNAADGRLLVRSRQGHDWKTDREGLVITVADTGPGMSKEVTSKAFQAFFTTKGIGGTGLGLWISKEIVDRHKGRLAVKSSQRTGHKGTVFTFFLPFDAAKR